MTLPWLRRIQFPDSYYLLLNLKWINKFRRIRSTCFILFEIMWILSTWIEIGAFSFLQYDLYSWQQFQFLSTHHLTCRAMLFRLTVDHIMSRPLKKRNPLYSIPWTDYLLRIVWIFHCSWIRTYLKMCSSILGSSMKTSSYKSPLR